MRKNLHSKFYFLKMLFLKCGKSVIIKKKVKNGTDQLLECETLVF